MKRLYAAVLVTASLASANVLAYGDAGHRTIGAIADRLLIGSNAQKQVAALLLPGESLESASLWADCIKGSFCGPLSQEMNEYVAANPKHSEYHYTDIPFQLSEYKAGAAGTTDHDIVQMLQQCILVLQGRDDATTNPHKLTKRQALLLLTHLAEDIHQPMHVGSAYIDKDNKFVAPETKAQVDSVNIFDLRGDNDLVFADPAYDRRPYPDRPVASQNLHFFWDITAVENAFQRKGVKTSAEFADKFIAEKPVMDLNKGEAVTWPKQWADDTIAMSKAAHEGMVPVARKTNVTSKGATYSTWTVNVPANYPDMAGALTATQLARGGYHFATLLQKIWP